MIVFSELQTHEYHEVIALWKTCNLTRPWNDPHKDISFAVDSENATILVGKKETEIIASAMLGHDGHRGSVYYLAVHPDHQSKGIGRALMKAVENWLKAKGVWKINLLVREDNLQATGFYKALGFERNAVISFGKKIG